MKTNCVNNFLNLIQQIQMLQKNRQYCNGAILILDEITSKIISPLITLDLLFDHGIRSLQKASLKKKRYQDACGIYYISEMSFHSVIKDFEDKENPTYFSINLVFSEPATNQTIKQLSKHESVISRVAWFGELYLNTLYLTENIATFAPFHYVKSFEEIKQKTKSSAKGKQGKQQGLAIELAENKQSLKNVSFMNDVFYSNLTLALRLGRQLVISLISSFGSHIYLDLYYQNNSKFCQIMVKQLQKQMMNHLKTLQQEATKKAEQMAKKREEKRKQRVEEEQTSERIFKNQKGEQKQEKHQELYKIIKIVIADRKLDLLSPAIHNFYYYPMMMDLQQKHRQNESESQQIGLQKIIPKISLNNDKQISIQLEDPVFLQYKNIHMTQALTKINQDLKKFVQQNKVAQFSKAKTNQTDKESYNNSNNLTEVIRSLPQYNKIMQSYKLHIDIMDQLINVSKDQNLSEIGDLQHLIVSKITNKDEQLKDKKIIAKVLAILDSIKSPSKKVRLIYVALCGLQMSDSERNNLVKYLNSILQKSSQGNQKFPQSFANLAEKINEHLGKAPIRLPQISKKYFFLDRHETKISQILRWILQKKSEKDIQMSLCIKNIKIGNDFIIKTMLNEKKFEIKTLQKIGKNKNENMNQFVVFMVGGISYNQISNIERVFSHTQGNRINYIVDALYTPSGFLNAFSKLSNK